MSVTEAVWRVRAGVSKIEFSAQILIFFVQNEGIFIFLERFEHLEGH